MNRLKRFKFRHAITLYVLALLFSFLFQLEAIGNETYYDKESLRPSYSLNSPLPLISNEYIGLSVEEVNGRFTIGTTGGDPENAADDDQVLLYGHPWPWTSFTTVRIDGEDFVYGDNRDSFSQTPTNSIAFNTSTVTINNIAITQILTLINNPYTGRTDTLEIRYQVINNDPNNSHNIGLRVLLDTMLGGNDGAPFQIPSTVSPNGPRTTETEYTGNNIPEYWQAFNTLTNPTVISQGRLRGGQTTVPDRFVLASWPDIYSTVWDYQVTPGKIFGSSSYPDSAIAIYWNPIQLDSYEIKE